MLQILRGLVISNSKIFPAEVSKGNLVQEKTSNPEQAEKATNNFLGIVIQNVKTDGIPFEIQNAGIPIDDVPINHAATIRSGEGEIVTDVVDGSLAGASVGNKLGILAGEWRVVQGGDFVFGELLEKDWHGNTGQYRISVFKTAVPTP